MEMALKGRIASVSPFLLISRDRRTGRRGLALATCRSASSGQEMDETVSHLIGANVADGHCGRLGSEPVERSTLPIWSRSRTFPPVPLDEHFRTFWDRVRGIEQDHAFRVAEVVRPGDPGGTTPTAAQALFADVRWPAPALARHGSGRKYAAYGSADHENVCPCGRLTSRCAI